MAGNPWRCAQCGAVNEPDSTSCRSCGKWASLFDLENDATQELELEEPKTAVAVAPAPELVHVPELEVEALEAEAFDAETFEPERAGAGDAGPRRMRPGRVLRSLLVPIAVLVYLVVSLLSER